MSKLCVEQECAEWKVCLLHFVGEIITRIMWLGFQPQCFKSLFVRVDIKRESYFSKIVAFAFLNISQFLEQGLTWNVGHRDFGNKTVQF
eukprot:m.357893 g.357893  ORF g.357893 m.357893 type:complete len:89 (+) comp20757_c0_seq3:1912-2178(+)